MVVLGVAGALVVPPLLAGGLPYRARFADGWDVGDTQGGQARVDRGAYVLSAGSGWRMWKSAPVSSGDTVVVKARARVEAGAGEFGVWCRGDTGTGDRYEFSVGAGGVVTIAKRRSGKPDTMLYGPARAKGDTGAITARCGQAGGGVTLALWLGGDKVAEAVDGDSPYGPGAVGVHVAPQGEQQMRVRFDSFEAAAG
ncbi:hypothetical protein OIE66_33955 [Nonomuraea sp. NBC_01738]|uniref:hypothetical protein n=1 Tax=Nonomuraea sp. NBC_01738 TaxID=2976003 RepID=UPI002E1459DD|nr:hypothetical protein OIE66_33955 [Nonomuraea sp. NBC_01738]